MADTAISESIQSGAQFVRAFLGTALKHSDDIDSALEFLVDVLLSMLVLAKAGQMAASPSEGQ